MVIPMPERERSPQDRTDRGGLSTALTVRLTAAQLRGVELLAEQHGEKHSAIVRTAVERYLESFTDADGVTLLELLERDVANERVSSKRLLALARGPAAASGRS
jgi:predicted DNA-binding protein